MSILLISVIVALIVLFLHATTWEGAIFEKVEDWTFNWHPKLKKPLFDCPICMSPWYGSLILFVGNITNVWSVTSVTEWIFILFTAGGLNTVIVKLSNNDD